jgi:CheY-like chemotaxis protein
MVLIMVIRQMDESKSVLWVEDEIEMEKIVLDALVESGVTVHVAANLEEAIWAAQNHKYDLIISDDLIHKNDNTKGALFEKDTPELGPMYGFDFLAVLQFSQTRNRNTPVVLYGIVCNPYPYLSEIVKKTGTNPELKKMLYKPELPSKILNCIEEIIGKKIRGRTSGSGTVKYINDFISETSCDYTCGSCGTNGNLKINEDEQQAYLCNQCGDRLNPGEFRPATIKTYDLVRLRR